MSIKTVKFQLGKEISVKEINEFFRTAGLDRTQIIHAALIQKSPNTAAYLITYEDITAPYVVGTFPENGFTNVPLSSDVVVQMSEQVDTVQWTNGASTDIEVRKNGTLVDPSVVGGSVTPSAGSWPSSGFTIQNAVDDTANAVYQITLKTTIEDTLGNTMQVPHVFAFTAVDEVSGISFKQGRITPTVAQIGSGFVDLTFDNDFPTANWRLSDSFHSSSALPDPTGCPLRWDPATKTKSGQRVYFDFPFPTGAMIEWLAMYGAEETLTP